MFVYKSGRISIYSPSKATCSSKFMHDVFAKRSILSKSSFKSWIRRGRLSSNCIDTSGIGESLISTGCGDFGLNSFFNLFNNRWEAGSQKLIGDISILVLSFSETHLIITICSFKKMMSIEED